MCLGLETRALTYRVKLQLLWAYERTPQPPNRENAMIWCKNRLAEASLDGSAEVRAQLGRLDRHLIQRRKEGYVPTGPQKLRVERKDRHAHSAGSASQSAKDATVSSKPSGSASGEAGFKKPAAESQHSSGEASRVAGQPSSQQGEAVSRPSSSSDAEVGPFGLPPGLASELLLLQRFRAFVALPSSGSEGQSGARPADREGGPVEAVSQAHLSAALNVLSSTHTPHSSGGAGTSADRLEEEDVSTPPSPSREEAVIVSSDIEEVQQQVVLQSPLAQVISSPGSSPTIPYGLGSPGAQGGTPGVVSPAARGAAHVAHTPSAEPPPTSSSRSARGLDRAEVGHWASASQSSRTSSAPHQARWQTHMETREYMASVANYPSIGLPADVVGGGAGPSV